MQYHERLVQQRMGMVTTHKEERKRKHNKIALFLVTYYAHIHINQNSGHQKHF